VFSYSRRRAPGISATRASAWLRGSTSSASAPQEQRRGGDRAGVERRGGRKQPAARRLPDVAGMVRAAAARESTGRADEYQSVDPIPMLHRDLLRDVAATRGAHDQGRWQLQCVQQNTTSRGQTSKSPGGSGGREFARRRDRCVFDCRRATSVRPNRGAPMRATFISGDVDQPVGHDPVGGVPPHAKDMTFAPHHAQPRDPCPRRRR
jgi:hypothetical protein